MKGSCSHQSEGSEKRALGTFLSRQTGGELWGISSISRSLSFSPASLTAQVIWVLGEERVTRRAHGLFILLDSNPGLWVGTLTVHLCNYVLHFRVLGPVIADAVILGVGVFGGGHISCSGYSSNIGSIVCVGPRC